MLLVIDIGTSKYSHNTNGGIFSEFFDILNTLKNQLPGGNKYQDPRMDLPREFQFLEDGQHISQGFPCSRLGYSEHVCPRKYNRKGTCLDWSWFCKTEIGNGVLYLLIDCQ